MDKIARALGADRRGKVHASAGYFGAIDLLTEVAARFRTPSGSGRPTDARWTERRLIPLAPRTLARLEAIAIVGAGGSEEQRAHALDALRRTAITAKGMIPESGPRARRWRR